MKKSLLLKCLAVSLCVAMVFCGFSGCKKEKVQTVREFPALDSLLYPYIKSEQECRVTYNDAGYPTVCDMFSSDGMMNSTYIFEYDDNGYLCKREFKTNDVISEEAYFDTKQQLEKLIKYSNEGVILSSKEYKNGSLICSKNYQSGVLQMDEFYEDDQLVKSLCYRSDGSVCHETIRKDGISTRYAYCTDGSVEEIIKEKYIVYGCGGPESTQYISKEMFYTNGNTQSFSEYDETGKYHQKHTEYREDGTVERVREYNSFGLTKLSLYDEKGELIEWTEYTYDENGKVTSNVNHIAE